MSAAGALLYRSEGVVGRGEGVAARDVAGGESFLEPTHTLVGASVV